MTTWTWSGTAPVYERWTSVDGQASHEVVWVFDELGHRLLGAIAATDGETRRYVCTTDYLGTPKQLLDEKGRVVWSANEPEDPTAELNVPFRWPGQYADDETGLHYNLFRYFDPSTERYLSPDPLGLDAGVGLYAYPADPTLYIDPLGLIRIVQVTLEQLRQTAPELAQGYSEFITSTPAADIKGRNVGGALLDSGATEFTQSLAAGKRTSPRNLGHSEQLLLQGGTIHGQHHAPLVTDLDGLKAIVTERSPCKGCTSMLEQMLPEDFPVYYFVEHTPGQESRMAREINDVRKSCH